MFQKSLGIMELIQGYSHTEEMLPNQIQNLDLNEDNGDAVIDQLQETMAIIHARDVDIALQQHDNNIDQELNNMGEEPNIDIKDLLVIEQPPTAPQTTASYNFYDPTPTELLAATLEKRAFLLKKLKDKKDKKRKPKFRYSRNGKLSSKAYRNNKKKHSYHRW